MREKISSKEISKTVILSSQRRVKNNFKISRITLGLTVMVVAAVLAACSPASPTPAPGLLVPPTVTTASSTSTAAPAAATATPLDPCQLLPSQEASQLAGVSFGPGEASTDVGGLNLCTYGANTTNVFTVEVVQAADATTAQGQEAQFMAELQSKIPQLTTNGLIITQLPNLGDGGIMGEATLTAINVNGGAIGFVKGKTFFGFSDLVQGGPAPTTDALQAEATTVLTRLP